MALVGHRGSGKTSLNEALLFEAGAINRLGSVADGTTVSDSAPDEKEREMSIASSLSSFTWQDRKINLVDTPGEPSFVADALAALRVCEGSVFVVNAVMGVEVSTERLWERAEELELSRIIFVNMLDRERADFFRTLDSLKDSFGAHVVATEIPIGSEHDVTGVIDLIDMKAYTYEGDSQDNCKEIPIPEELQAQAEEYREKLMDEVAEVSDELMERYLEGEEISHEEIVQALKNGVTNGTLFPVTCGVATKNLATNRLLDALVEDLPSPVKKGAFHAGDRDIEAEDEGDAIAFVFKTLADPFAGKINLMRVYHGVVRADSQLFNTRAHVKERMGQLLVPEGKEMGHADELGAGDIGAVAKLKETHAGDVLASKDEPVEIALPKLPVPVMAFAIEPKHKGDEDKVFTALRRLQEEDPTIDVHRDDQTGEQIVAGLTQIHVEVIVDRMKERFGAEVTLKPPRVPYRETIKGTAKAHGRYKKQTGGRGQFGDCHIEIEPIAGDPTGFEFENKIKGGVIPSGFIPAVEKGVREAMDRGIVAGYPLRGVKVQALRRLVPLRRLVGDGVQDGRLDGVQAGRRTGAGVPARADHDRHRRGARGLGRRRDRRPERPPRSPARDGAEGLDDRGEGGGADGGGADLRAGPARDHGRPGRLHDGAGALRGSAVAPGPEGDPAGRGRGRSRQGVAQ